MIISAFPAGRSSYIPPLTESEFSYTGDYTLLDDGDGNWRLKFLSSGILIPLRDMLIDVFLVGGGGPGGGHPTTAGGTGHSRGGGGSGYTVTHKKVVLYAGVEYSVVIGAGGVGTNAIGTDGGSTSFGIYSAEGGKAANVNDGGNGACGGGGSPLGSNADRNPGNGGSNGADGADCVVGTYTGGRGGKGQGTNTLEFGEEGAELYAGGGAAGGSATNSNSWCSGADGGAGGTTSLTEGGGIGGKNGGLPTQPNIGGKSPMGNNAGGAGGGYGAGGGGASGGTSGTPPELLGGDGCQGIAVIRNHRAA